VGLVPLMLERRWGFQRLLFIGTGLTRLPRHTGKVGMGSQGL